MKKEKEIDDKRVKRGRPSLYKILIILALILGLCAFTNSLFEAASDKVEDMTQEERDEINDKWNDLMDQLQDE